MPRRLTVLLVCLLLSVLPLSSFAVTSNVYTVRGTPITFKASGGTYVINMDGMTTLLGSWSAQADLGTSPQPSSYAWQCNVRMSTAGVLGEHVDFYLALGDGTDITGAPMITTSASSTGALTLTTQLPNVVFLGSVFVDVSDSTKSQTGMGTVTIVNRYISLIAFNATTKTLNATANINYCSLTPLYFQSQ